ncbi:C40 family peptidase [Actinomadura rugatobispora]|uniref:NlpC/P60 family protein n=1 Tax=Actinomadura rugatobispora TaxID=1994 RepID=A0ABW1AJE1_9ACTN|nr:C40 family peptidase [Actinomadura rugatobispora]
MASDLTGAGPLPQRGRPGAHTGRGGSRRLTATVCLAVTASLTVPVTVLPATAAHADPRPSAAEARKKLTKLNEQVEQLVEKYNQVQEKLKVAKKKWQATQKAGKEELTTFNELQGKIAQMAAAAYKAGNTGDVAGFVGADNPQAVLDQAAVFEHLSRNRSSELAQFLGSAQRLRREQAQAKAAYDEVAKQAKDLKAQKAEVEKGVQKQKKLLAQLGETTSSGGGTGGSYTGPASGSARVALNFAYAQLGKPYSYGAAGPSSYDCSGLTMKSWGAAGVGITRTTNSQYAATKRVAKSALQPGDLVFFNNLGHVGLFVGGGKMIHAPRTGKNVEVVSITSGYYLSNYFGAGRP